MPTRPCPWAAIDRHAGNAIGVMAGAFFVLAAVYAVLGWMGR